MTMPMTRHRQGVLAQDVDPATHLGMVPKQCTVHGTGGRACLQTCNEHVSWTRRWRAARRCQLPCRQNPSSISLKAGCELFLRYTTRTSAIEHEDFAATKARLIERGNQFADTSARARSAIADAGSRFLTNGCTVLCHGFSRVIVDILRRARAQGAHFSVLVTEGRPGEAAVRIAQELVPVGIDTTIILDSAAAYHMDRCAARALFFAFVRQLATR
jgi:Initiation factor 2 subunit family